MKKKIFSKRETVMLAILAVIVLFALYYFFIHQPLEEKKSAANNEISLLDSEIPILQAKAIQMNNMKTELDELKVSGSVVDIPEYDNLSEIILFLNSVLQDRPDYEVSFVDAYRDETDNFVHRIATISFTTTSYESAEEAIQMLQNAPFLLRISEVMIEPANNAPDLVSADGVNVSLQIIFYELDAKDEFKTETEEAISEE